VTDGHTDYNQCLQMHVSVARQKLKPCQFSSVQLRCSVRTRLYWQSGDRTNRIHWTFVPDNFRSRERKFSGRNFKVPWIIW